MHHRHIYISSDPSRQVSGITGMPGVTRPVSAITPSTDLLFNVATYGADPTGIDDSTAAITAAADAAGAVSTASNRAIVYFPAGTYKVIPPGTMSMRVFEKSAGTWGSAEVGLTDFDGSGAETYTTTTGYTWHFLQADPTTQGSDGDKAINHLTGETFTKAGGTWTGSSIGNIIEYSEVLGTADLFDPDDANGVNGDFYFQYYLSFTNNSSVFAIYQAWNNVTFQGASKATTTLQFKCWGDKAANDYAESGGTITRSAIMPSQFYDTTAATDTQRGFLFRIDSDGTHATTPLTGFHFENMTWNGSSGAYVSGQNHSFGNYLNGLTAWDLSHKAIATSFGGDGDISDVKFTNIDMREFRGELVHGGGDTDHDLTFTDCDFSICHASALSSPGPITMTGCTFDDVYNGFECQVNPTPSGDQTITIYDTHFTLDDSKGQFCALVFSNSGANGTAINIGNPLGTAYRDVTVTGGNRGVLMNTKCKNLTISNTLFEDVQVSAVYSFNNLIGTYIDYDFDNLTFDTVEFKATTVTLDNCLQMNALTFSGSDTAVNWSLSDCICTENGAQVDTFLNVDSSGPNHDITVTDCTTAGVKDFSAGDGVAATVINTTREWDRVFTSTTTPPNWGATAPELNVTRVGADGQNGFTFNNTDIVNNYPANWPMTIYYNPTSDPSFACNIPATTWNSLSADESLADGGSISFTYNAATNVFDKVV
jgi:hypothetical protein